MSKDDWCMLMLAIAVVVHGLWLSILDFRIWKLEQKKRRPWNHDEND